MSGPTSMPFLKAFAFACVTAIVAGIVNYGKYDPTSRVVREGTKVFLSALFIALIVGLWARYSSRRWSLWRFGLIYLIGLVILGIIGSIRPV